MRCNKSNTMAKTFFYDITSIEGLYTCDKILSTSKLVLIVLRLLFFKLYNIRCYFPTPLRHTLFI